MKNKQYPLHHDHDTVTISRDVLESITAELERLRPMEASLELAEANRNAYKKRVEELTAEHHKERDEYIDWVNRLQKENAEFKAMVVTDNSEVIAMLEDELRKQKHKRCLAMAMRCRLNDEMTQWESERIGLDSKALFISLRRKAMWWNKWRKRWLSLADKFKKET